MAISKSRSVFQWHCIRNYTPNLLYKSHISMIFSLNLHTFSSLTLCDTKRHASQCMPDYFNINFETYLIMQKLCHRMCDNILLMMRDVDKNWKIHPYCFTSMHLVLIQQKWGSYHDDPQSWKIWLIGVPQVF